VLIPFLLAALPISLADIKSYAIPNIYLIWLAFLCTPYVLLHGLGPVPRILAIVAILAVLQLSGLGIGDVKLIAIVALMLNSEPQPAFHHLGICLILCAVVHVIMETLWKGELPRKIALAPSIFLALRLYLATT
jgi:Flp pilus assembly protein protease CpaA